MASYTTNLNLKKPAGSENVAIGDINNNMDAIDAAYGTLNSKITAYESLTITAADGVTLNNSKALRCGYLLVINCDCTFASGSNDWTDAFTVTLPSGISIRENNLYCAVAATDNSGERVGTFLNNKLRIDSPGAKKYRGQIVIPLG